MNTPTNRCSTPAVATRTGRGGFALPRDPGLDRLLADPDLGSTAKTIATVLVKHWAWVKDHCWPSVRTIAAKVGKSPGQVQRALRELERAGWIVRERTDARSYGRLIRLLWRAQPLGAGAQRVSAPALSGPERRRSTNIVVVTRGEKESEQFARGKRSRPEPPPIPPDAPTPRATELPAGPDEEISPQSPTPPAPTDVLPPPAPTPTPAVAPPTRGGPRAEAPTSGPRDDAQRARHHWLPPPSPRCPPGRSEPCP